MRRNNSTTTAASCTAIANWPFEHWVKLFALSPSFKKKKKEKACLALVHSLVQCFLIKTNKQRKRRKRRRRKRHQGMRTQYYGQHIIYLAAHWINITHRESGRRRRQRRRGKENVGARQEFQKEKSFWSLKRERLRTTLWQLTHSFIHSLSNSVIWSRSIH